MDSQTTPAPASGRLMSIDALRGFDMFWIIGGNGVVLGIAAMLFGKLPDWFVNQFEHVPWEGFVAWDLIMPLFLFITGTSMPFSFSKRLEGGSKAKLYLKIVRRTLILFVLGMAAQGHLLDFDLSRLHVYCNTLQSIAVGYLVAAIVMLNLSVLWQGVVTAALLIAFWLLMAFVPVPGHGAGVLTEAGNLAIYVDDVVLGRFSDGTPYTWVLSGLTFAVSVLLGVMSGHVLRSNNSAAKKFGILVGAGLGCLALGWLWSLTFPIIKHLWTSSMVLWAAGWSFLLLAVFYGVIDGLGLKKWAFPFVVIGTNAIFVYMATHLISFNFIAASLTGGLAKHCGDHENAVLNISAFLIVWLILLYMYRKKTFIRSDRPVDVAAPVCLKEDADLPRDLHHVGHVGGRRAGLADDDVMVVHMKLTVPALAALVEREKIFASRRIERGGPGQRVMRPDDEFPVELGVPRLRHALGRHPRHEGAEERKLRLHAESSNGPAHEQHHAGRLDGFRLGPPAPLLPMLIVEDKPLSAVLLSHHDVQHIAPGPGAEERTAAKPVEKSGRRLRGVHAFAQVDGRWTAFRETVIVSQPTPHRKPHQRVPAPPFRQNRRHDNERDEPRETRPRWQRRPAAPRRMFHSHP